LTLIAYIFVSPLEQSGSIRFKDVDVFTGNNPVYGYYPLWVLGLPKGGQKCFEWISPQGGPFLFDNLLSEVSGLCCIFPLSLFGGHIIPLGGPAVYGGLL